MKLPKLPNDIRHNQIQTMSFRGLNLTNETNDGELADSLGMTSSEYPFLTQIPKREQLTTYSLPTDIYVWDRHLYVVDGTNLKKDGEIIGTVTPGLKHMAVINTKLVIYPDKVYVDLTDDTVHPLVKNNFHRVGLGFTLTSNSIQVSQNYGKIGDVFADGDVVDIVGEGVTANRIVVLKSEDYKLTFADGSIVFDTAPYEIYVRNSVPELDFICSSNNRIWGVCNEDNTVYASALGDPTTFFDYTSESGSYSVAIGSEGDFTGICSYGGTVLVWKENILHKIMGAYPSEYYTIDYPVHGVQKGSEKSLAVINNVLFYKGVFGVYQYGGNRPISISENLGSGIYTNAVAGSDGKKYYINMADPEGNYHLYAYDLVHGLWMKEEDGQMSAIANLDRTVYYVRNDYLSSSLQAIGDEVSDSQQWMAEMVETTENTFNRKGYLKLLVRLDMPGWSSMKIYAKEDRRPYREIWSRDNLVKKYLLNEIPLSDLSLLPIDNIPAAGDVVVFTCSGFDGEQRGVWESQSYGLSAWVSFDAFKYIDLKCYTDPADEKYKMIEFEITWDGPLTDEVSMWVPTFPINPVTMLVPIRLGRCDRWQLKFEGTGKTVIRAIGRENVFGGVK